MSRKSCTACKLPKSIENFHRNPKSKDGRQSKCKECANLYAKEHRSKQDKDVRRLYDQTYYQKNQNKILNRKKEYYEENKEEILSKVNIYNSNHKEEKKIYNQNYHKNNNDKITLKQKEYYQNNKDKIKEYQIEYNKENSNYIKDRSNNYMKKRYASEINFKLRSIISVSIREAIKENDGQKSGSILKFLPYTIEQLKCHLENLFEPWMTWENHGKYNAKTWNDDDPSTWIWQIDHIIPQSLFKYTTMDCQEFRDCWALSNLRPLSAKQNHIDGSTRSRHF